MYEDFYGDFEELGLSAVADFNGNLDEDSEGLRVSGCRQERVGERVGETVGVYVDVVGY